MMSVTTDDLILFAVVGGLSVNYALLRLPRWETRRALFWATQALILAAACFLLAWGIPGLQGDLQFANWMLGLLFLFHIVTNNNRLQAAQRASRDQLATQDDDRRAHIRQALRRGTQTTDLSDDEDEAQP